MIEYYNKVGELQHLETSREGITLGEWIEFNEFYEKEQALLLDINALSEQIKTVPKKLKPDLEIRECEMWITNRNLVKKQVSILLNLHESELDSIPYSAILAARNDFSYKKPEPSAFFKFPEALKHEVDVLKQELKECSIFEFSKRKGLKRKIEEFKIGEFWITPAARQFFQSKIATDFLRGNLPKPEKETQEWLKENGLTFEEAYSQILKGKTFKDFENNQKQELAIKKYALKLISEDYKIYPALISHIVVPKADPKYNYEKAEDRIQFFHELPLAYAESIVNFIKLLHTISKSYTKKYSLKKVKKQK
jgi:hypothetical protein